MRRLLLALKPRATVCGQRRFWDRLDARGQGGCWGGCCCPYYSHWCRFTKCFIISWRNKSIIHLHEFKVAASKLQRSGEARPARQPVLWSSPAACAASRGLTQNQQGCSKMEKKRIRRKTTTIKTLGNISAFRQVWKQTEKKKKEKKQGKKYLLKMKHLKVLLWGWRKSLWLLVFWEKLQLSDKIMHFNFPGTSKLTITTVPPVCSFCSVLVRSCPGPGTKGYNRASTHAEVSTGAFGRWKAQ